MLPVPTCALAQGDRFRGAGRKSGDAEAAVAVEVDQRLAQRRGPAAAFGGDVEAAVEVDRGKLTAGERLRLEAAVGAEDDVFDFDQGTGRGPGQRRRGDQGEERRPSQPAVWHGEVRVVGKLSPLVKVSLPSTCRRPPEQWALM